MIALRGAIWKTLVNGRIEFNRVLDLQVCEGGKRESRKDMMFEGQSHASVYRSITPRPAISLRQTLLVKFISSRASSLSIICWEHTMLLPILNSTLNSLLLSGSNASIVLDFECSRLL